MGASVARGPHFESDHRHLVQILPELYSTKRTKIKEKTIENGPFKKRLDKEAPAKLMFLTLLSVFCVKKTFLTSDEGLNGHFGRPCNDCWVAYSVTSKKFPNVYKSYPKMISLKILKIFMPLQKLPTNVGDLGNLIVAKGFEKLPKVQ